jgi:hypothetical protein
MWHSFLYHKSSYVWDLVLAHIWFMLRYALKSGCDTLLLPLKFLPPTLFPNIPLIHTLFHTCMAVWVSIWCSFVWEIPSYCKYMKQSIFCIVHRIQWEILSYCKFSLVPTTSIELPHKFLDNISRLLQMPELTTIRAPCKNLWVTQQLHWEFKQPFAKKLSIQSLTMREINFLLSIRNFISTRWLQEHIMGVKYNSADL